jgi:ATP-binding cassette, subfamily B, bacterial
MTADGASDLTGPLPSAGRIARLFLPHRWALAGTALLVLLQVGLSTAGPLLLQQIVSKALPDHQTRLLIVLCAIMIVFSTLAWAASAVVASLTNSVGQRVMHRLRTSVFEHVQRLPLEFFSAESNSQIQARIASDIGDLSDIVTYTIQGALVAVTGLLAGGLAMAILSWPLALVSLALSIPLNLLNRRYSSRREQLAARRQEQVAVMMEVVSEDLSLSGVVLGRTLRAYRRQGARFAAASQRVSDLTYHQRMAGNTARSLVGLSLACIPPLIYLLAGTAMPGVSLGTVVVISVVQARISGPTQMLLGLSVSTRSARAMLARVFAYLDLPAEPCGASQDLTPAARHVVRGRSICHRYGNAARAAVDGVDIEFDLGSVTLITGESGCGKSTLALILAGLLVPSRGVVEIDRCRAAPEQLWAAVTLVPQENQFCNASMRENMLVADPDASDEEVLAAMTVAHADGLLARLPDGLDTTVGANGYQLSGGERQRLAIARAVLARSDLLILDESTSALDNVTAEQVMRSVRAARPDCALVLVAHRIPEMEPDDQVLVLADGKIVERGSHRDLARPGYLYQRVILAQAAAASGSGSGLHVAVLPVQTLVPAAAPVPAHATEVSK